MENQDYISASDIGSYLYCERTWYYKLKGIKNQTTEAMTEGIKAHEKLNQKVMTSNRLFQGFKILIAIGLLLLLVALIWFLFLK
jgi:CRISPR/Cas system-associated exonuclease Cas4 (RecB family)